MTNPLPLLHIGYHKTATTWMQNQLFVPRHGFRQLAGHQTIFEKVVTPHGLTFTPKPMQAHIEEAWQTLKPGEVPVISSEILSGHPFFGGRESDLYARRLKKIFPDARILVSIRNQMRILPSVYMQYLLRGGTMPYDRFFREENDLGFFSFSAVHFEYDRLIGLYQSLFGVEHVYVLTQESLRQDMDEAAERLAKFCDNKRFESIHPDARAAHTPSYPEYAVPVLRRINQVQSSVLNPNPFLHLGHTPNGLYRGAGYLLKRPLAKKLLGRKKPVTSFVKGHFSGRYSDSNHRLRSLVGEQTDLSNYD
ncbi:MULTISPECIES: sulfotransferase [unclassified Ruegeria]|uniref:sulfotransferase n=1 Tax=unclassified Ruegeria TaxID=2625375 RepID=UPI001489323E|nr:MULTISPECIES: sulfotransferase [unclassified Ruegeria]